MVLKLQDAISKVSAENEDYIGRLRTYVANDRPNLTKVSALESEVTSLKEALKDRERELADTRGAILGAGVELKEQHSKVVSELEAARTRVKELENALEERSDGAKAEVKAEKEKLKRASQHLAEREETLKRAEKELEGQRKLIGVREGMVRLVPAGPVSGEPIEEQCYCPNCSSALSEKDLARGVCPSCRKGFSTVAEEVEVYECPSCARTLTSEAVAAMKCPFCSARFGPAR
jgi:isoleucyl-tRNA synthetase